MKAGADFVELSFLSSYLLWSAVHRSGKTFSYENAVNVQSKPSLMISAYKYVVLIVRAEAFLAVGIHFGSLNKDAKLGSMSILCLKQYAILAKASRRQDK